MIGPDQTYSNSLFTDDRVNLSRNLDTGKGVDSTVQITGSGTIGVDEYQAQTRENPKRVMQCSLLPVTAGAVQHDEITASGLFQSGQYLSHREITNESTRSQTSINGTGQVLMKSASTDGNTSTRGTTYAGGPMQIQEQVLFNGGETMSDITFLVSIISSAVAGANTIAMVLMYRRYLDTLPVSR